MKNEDLMHSLADELYHRRSCRSEKKILVFTPVPPQRTGIANFTLKMHMADSAKYDLISEFSSPEEYQREIETWGDNYNVYPYSYYMSEMADLPYLAKIFVLGNSPYHFVPFEEAVRTKGERNRYLYFHEALCHTALMRYLTKKHVSPFEYISTWYPEVGKYQHDFENMEWHQFCHKYSLYGVRAFISYTGITNLVVNNSRCKKIILDDLPDAQKAKVRIFQNFLPIEFSCLKPKTDVKKTGELLIGSFGEPSNLKGTDILLKAVQMLNEHGCPCKLLLGGYFIKRYLSRLPVDYSPYCDIYENITDTDEFIRLMTTVDIAVQLRLSEHGESSGCISQLLGTGTPLIVNKSFADENIIPYISCVPDNVTPEELGKIILKVFQSPAVSREQRKHNLNEFSFDKAARSLYRMIYKDCMKERFNLGFDVSQIASVGNGTLNRDGIYLTSVRILEGLAATDHFNIKLYCRPEYFPNLREMRKESDFWKSFELCKSEHVHNQSGRFENGNILDNKYQNLDFFFSPMFAIPDEVKNKPGTKAFLFLYDALPALFPDWNPAWKDPDFWHAQIVRSLCRKETYFCDSNSTKHDFVKLTKLPSKNFVTAYLGANELFYCCTDQAELKRVQEKYHLPTEKKYIFSLCSISPRKNLPFVIKNFIRFVKENNIHDFIFILGGGGTQKLFQDLIDSGDISADDLREYIYPCGYIADADLAPLYSFAEFFVCLSLYEGFGLPCLEAMQCGCPVIASNTSSIPEVVGDAGILIPPTDAAALLDSMYRLYYDSSLKSSFRKKSLAMAQSFSWKKTIDIIDHNILLRKPYFHSIKRWMMEHGLFAHKKIQFCCTDPDMPVDSNFPPLKMKSYFFSKEEPDFILGDAFHAREPWGAWLGQLEGTLFFILPKHGNKRWLVFQTNTFGPLKRVYVKYKDVVLTEWDMSDPANNVHIVDASALPQGIPVGLTFEQDALFKPCDLIPGSSDKRCLGLGVISMTLQDMRMDMMQNVCYSLSEKQDCIHFVCGSVQEPWGIWTVAKKAVLSVTLPEEPEKLILKVKAQAFGKVKYVDIFYGAEKIGHWDILNPSPGNYFLNCSNLPRKKEIQLTLENNEVSRPCDLIKGSTDDRTLGIGLFSLSIDQQSHEKMDEIICNKITIQ